MPGIPSYLDFQHEEVPDMERAVAPQVFVKHITGFLRSSV